MMTYSTKVKIMVLVLIFVFFISYDRLYYFIGYLDSNNNELEANFTNSSCLTSIGDNLSISGDEKQMIYNILSKEINDAYYLNKPAPKSIYNGLSRMFFSSLLRTLSTEKLYILYKKVENCSRKMGAPISPP